MLKISREKFYKILKDLGFKSMSTHNGERYYYQVKQGGGPDVKNFTITEEFEVKVDDTPEQVCNNKTSLEISDIRIYGWVIEWRVGSLHGKEHWVDFWKHKIYASKEVALHAINQVRGLGYSPSDFRITPLYKFTTNGYRNYIINKIIELK